MNSSRYWEKQISNYRKELEDVMNKEESLGPASHVAKLEMRIRVLEAKKNLALVERNYWEEMYWEAAGE